MTPPIRTVEVRPPSRSGETLAVFRACAVILFGTLVVVGPHLGARTDPQSELQPFQRLFRDVDPGLQRAYRAIQEGLIEAENARAASGEWPRPEDLASQGIPPFAADPTDKTPRAWTLAREGTNVEYRGTPAVSGEPELLISILEPGPGASERYDPEAPPDETHHRLTDGTLLHVSLWYRPFDPARARAIVRQPFAAGFVQILAGTTPGKRVP